MLYNEMPNIFSELVPFPYTRALSHWWKKRR